MNAKKLDQAKALVLEVRDSLNNKNHPCECCGHTVYEDWDARQMRDTLNAVVNRLEKTIEKISQKE